MPFLTVQGVPVPVASMDIEDASAMDRGSTQTGHQYRSGSGPTLHSFALTTPLLEVDIATPWELLLGGTGEVFNGFDHGSKGTGLETALQTHDGASHKFGTHFYQTAGADDFVDLTTIDGVFLDDGWTVMAWFNSGGGYTHFGLCGDGLVFEDGVVDYTATVPFSVDSAGMLTLDTAGDYDDIVVLPFNIPTEWLADLDLTAAFAALPLLNLGGDFWHEEIVAESMADVELAAQLGTTTWSLSAQLCEVELTPFELDPADMSDLLIWYDTSDITTLWQDSARTVQVTATLDLVEAIDDKSGNANHGLNASGDGVYSSTGFNGLPCIQFTGSANQMLSVTTTWGTSGGLGLFVALDPLEPGVTTEYLVARGAGGGIRVPFAIDSGTGVGPGFYDGAHKAWGHPEDLADTDVYSVVFDTGLLSTLRQRERVLGAPVAYTAFTDVSTTHVLGGAAGSGGTVGNLAEYILLNREPTALERIGLTNYLRRKWRTP